MNSATDACGPEPHKDSWLDLGELGRKDRPYKPTYRQVSSYINEAHRFYSTCPENGGVIDLEIKGWLLRADALKLYEMAYFANGDVLEIGCHEGLSASIMARAIRDAGTLGSIDTVDLRWRFVLRTRRNLARQSMGTPLRVQRGDGARICRKLQNKRREFAFVFVDHSHAYEPVRKVCETLDALVTDGGFVLFHDFNDKRNAHPGNAEYEVFQAVEEGLDNEAFEFFGIYGSTALYRKSSE